MRRRDKKRWCAELGVPWPMNPGPDPLDPRSGEPLLTEWACPWIERGIARWDYGPHGRLNSCDLLFIPGGLAAYELRDDERVDPGAAHVLSRLRQPQEADRGAISAVTWCQTCGIGFVDGNVALGRHVLAVAQWCDDCRDLHHRELRLCAAEGCNTYFWTTRANRFVCPGKQGVACNKAVQRDAA